MDRKFLNKDIYINVTHKYGTYDENGKKYSMNIGYADKPLTFGSSTLRAYVYGVKYPLKHFSGIVIAYGKRESGDDFVVVANKKVVAYDVNILPLLHEYEGEDFTLYTAYEKSCGVLIFKKVGDEIQYLLVRQRLSNSWSFPKGHIVFGESEKETALREVREEVGIDVDIIDGFRVEQYYNIKPCTTKKVIMFIAKAQGEIHIDNNEIINYVWTGEATLSKYLRRKSADYLIKRAKNFIIKNKL